MHSTVYFNSSQNFRIDVFFPFEFILIELREWKWFDDSDSDKQAHTVAILIELKHCVHELHMGEVHTAMRMGLSDVWMQSRPPQCGN